MKVIKYEIILAACLENLRDLDFKDRILRSSKFLKGANKVFEIHAVYGLVHLYADKHDESLFCAATRDNLISLYEDKLLKNKSSRLIYDELLDSAPLKMCELCHITRASTLDHYLPKTTFPSLAISSLNLIPSCKDCNTSKLSAVASTRDMVTLHPILDSNVYQRNWLAAILDETNQAFAFGAADCAGDYFSRIDNHLKVHGLIKSYSSRAAVIAADISISLSGYDAVEPETIRSELEEEWNKLYGACIKLGFTVHVLRLAVLSALKNSHWYINGGFRYFSAA
jgi:5-methylcytosine-specific restriction endonuclease McrA